MTELSRRGMLMGAAAATAAAALTPFASTQPARAAAPLSGKQAPGFYRYKVGDFELTAIADGVRPTALPDTFVRNANKSEVAAALQAAFIPSDQVPFAFTAVVVNTGSKLIVIDAGNGLGALEQSKGLVGQWHGNFAAAGFDPKAVDVVIISHFHGDHIGGLLGADSKLAFANAEVMVPKPEWDYYMDEAQMNRMPEGARGNFTNSRRVFGAFGNKVTQYEGEKDLVPGIRAVPTPGHTPGHYSHLVTSGNGSVMVQADVTAGVPVLFARNPGWHPAFDSDAKLAEETRRKLYDRMAADKTLVQGYHIPFPGIGYIEKDGNGYRIVPAAWKTML